MNMTDPIRPFDRFVKSFVLGKATGHGSWYGNVRSWLDSPLASDGNLLLIKYETMLTDTEDTLASVLRFLGVTVEPEAIRFAIANNNLQRMRAKEDRARATGVEVSGEKIRSQGRGVRNGSIGEWRTRLTDAQVKLIEDHARELLEELGYHSTLNGTGFESSADETGLDDTVPAGEFG